MWTRSAANKVTGKITVECTDWNGNLFFKGEFATVAEAEEAGTIAERRMTFEMNNGPAPVMDEMTDDELLAKLGI